MKTKEKTSPFFKEPVSEPAVAAAVPALPTRFKGSFKIGSGIALSARLCIMIAMLLTLSSCYKNEMTLPGNYFDPVQSDLILLHINDPRSQLLNAGPGMESSGGAARLVTLADLVRSESEADVHGNSFVSVSSGNSFSPGLIFDLSVNKGIPYYDAMALDMIGLDAILIAGRDFIMGPEILANYIESFKFTRPVFVSANLDFSGDPRLLSLQNAGRIAKSAIVERGRKTFGIVGLTSPGTEKLYSPGRVLVNKDIIRSVQMEADKLSSYGIDTIILLADFVDLNEGLRTIAELRNIDVVVTGGGMELLANEGTPLAQDRPEGTAGAFGPYPLLATNADKKLIPVVTTPGRFLYAGLLHAYFDSKGLLSHISRRSKLRRVIGETTGAPDAVAPNPEIQKNIILPIGKALSTNTRVIGETQVQLEGERNQLSSRETNLGKLCADAVLWAARRQAANFGAKSPTVAVINAGSIRGGIEKGKVTEADIFRIVSFNHFVSVVEDVSPKDFKNLIEIALSELRADKNESSPARFPQLSSCTIVYNPTRPVGSRVKELKTTSGAIVVRDYKLVEFAPHVDIATLDFIARGSEGWSFGGNRVVNLGVPMPNVLRDYIGAPASEGGLNKTVTETAYPLLGADNIFVTRE